MLLTMTMTQRDALSATYSSLDSGMTDQLPLRATFRIDPSLVIAGSADGGSIWPDTASATFVVDIEELRAHVVVPVAQGYGESRLTQTPTEGWQRILDPSDSPEEVLFHPPVLLSARTNWLLVSGSVEVYNRAYVIDGAQRLEAALRCGRPPKALVTVVLGLDPESELLLRNRSSGPTESAVRIITQQKFDSSSPRLKIDDTWVRLELRSEPFVMPTALGYAPAILVTRDGSDEIHHVIVGAKSFTQPLEDLRLRFETLNGVRIAVRKAGPERSDPYQVEFLDAGDR